MNFLTASVTITADDGKLNVQLAKAKQKVLKSTDAMEKAYVKSTNVFADAFKKAGGIALKAMVDVGTKVGLLVYSFTRLGLSIKAAFGITKYIVAFDLLSTAVGQTTLGIRNIWLGMKKVYEWYSKAAGYAWDLVNAGAKHVEILGMETKAQMKLNRTVKATQDAQARDDFLYRMPSVLGILLHPLRTYREVKFAMKEQAGLVDVVNDKMKVQNSLTKELGVNVGDVNEKFYEQVEAHEGINETIEKYQKIVKESKELLGRPAQTRMNVITQKLTREATDSLFGGPKMLDISGAFVMVYQKMYNVAAGAFRGILSVATGVFSSIFQMTKWRAAGISAAVVGMYVAVTQAAMNVEDALSMEELGPTRTILQGLREAFAGIAAVIGKPFLNSIRLVSGAITEWLDELTPKVKGWAESFAEHLRTLQTGFVDWIKFLTTDFRGGVSVALQIISEVFKGFVSALIVLMDFAGKRAGRALVDGMRGVVTRLVPSILDSMNEALGWLGSKLMKSSEQAARNMQRLTGIPVGRKDYQLGPRGATEEESASAAIRRVYKERAENIKKILEDMPTWGSTEVAATKLAEAAIQKSARVLMATGNAMAQHRAKMLEQGGTLAAMQLRLDVEEINRIMEDDFFGGFHDGIEQMKVDMVTWGDIGKGVAESMQSAFATAYYSMTTEGAKWADAMRGFALSVLKAFQRQLAAQTAAQVISGGAGLIKPILGGLAGLFGIGGGGTTADTATPELKGLQHGGEVLKTGLAVVHEGETYSGVKGGKPIVVNINKIGADFEAKVEEFEHADEHVVNIVVRDIVAGGKLATLIGAG